MGSPCEPLTPRQELVAACEALGLDGDAPADWRETYSDDRLRAEIDRLDTDYPELGELAEAIEELVASHDAVRAVTADTPPVGLSTTPRPIAGIAPSSASVGS